MAQQVMGALQPVIGAIMNNPLNILTQTPPADTYQNPTVNTWWQSFLAVVDLALASLIVIGGYNVVVGRHLGLPHSDLAEFLPRLLLAFGAAHFSLFFLGLFIDLENALNLVALNLAGTSMLTNIITALFQGNLATEGLLVWVLMFVLGVMAILLGAQMAVRLALLWVLLVLSGPGLACFALPQTLGYGRMWLSLTATTVLVQFFQVVTLALGGMLLTSLGASNVFGVGGTLATNTSHLRTSHKKFRGERIKQVDKIEKLLLRLKGLRWRHLTLLGFVLVVDLLDLPTVDTQTTCWQDVLCHPVSQALEQWLGCLLWLHGEGQRDHLGQFKDAFGKAEAIRI